jgi:hypothetical protein
MTDNQIGMGLTDNIIEPDDKVLEQARQELEKLQSKLAAMPAGSDDVARAKVQLDIASRLIALGRKQEAWDIAREIFDVFLLNSKWQEAVESCDVMYAADNDQSIIALGNGIWLAVTFPVDPSLSINLLDHVIEETPNDSDGAAVAAATAHYLAEIRAKDDKQRDSLGFLTGNLLAAVAYRHSQLKEREQIDFWVERLELDQPEKFLPRLAVMLDVIVGDNWWYDRDTLRSVLPEDTSSYAAEDD